MTANHRRRFSLSGAITLAIAGIVACNTCPSTVNTLVYVLAPNDADEDGGCLAACTAALNNSLGRTSCSFTTQDGGRAVSRTGPVETCP
jgi:hypothetical protein